jgi:hypothetical protein
MHLTISRGACEGCGYMADCFNCSPAALIRRKPIQVAEMIRAYRNTKQIKYGKDKI